MNKQSDKLLDSEGVETLIAEMADNIRQQLNERGIVDPLMVGIRSGGVWLAQRLHRELGLEEPLGTLDISFYRDDFTRIGMNPEVHPSDLSVPMDDRETDATRPALRFSRQLEGRFRLKVYLADERFTSFEARDRLGHKVKRKEEYDAVAAKLILETWLNERTEQ